MDSNSTDVTGDPLFDVCQKYYTEQYADIHVVMWGAALSLGSYGVIVGLFVGSVYWLKKNWLKPRLRDTKTIALMVYLFVMFSLSTVTAVSVIEAISNNYAFETCDPSSYYDDSESDAESISDFVPLAGIGAGGIIGVSGALCSVFSNFLADCLLAWRCFMMYKESRLFKIAAIVPILIMLTSGVLGVLTISLSSFFLIFYYAATLLANLTFTLMIVIRLYIFRRRIQQSLGKGYGNQYAGIITMIIESEGLTLAVEIWLFISIWSDTAGQVVQIPFLFLVQAQVIAPLLLIFRVAQGKAWSNRVLEDLASGNGPVFAQTPRTPASYGTYDPKDMTFSATEERGLMDNVTR